MKCLSFSSAAIFLSLIILTTGCKKENPGDNQDLEFTGGHLRDSEKVIIRFKY